MFPVLAFASSETRLTCATVASGKGKSSWLKRGYKALKEAVFSPRATRGKQKRAVGLGNLGKENGKEPQVSQPGQNAQLQAKGQTKVTGRKRDARTTVVQQTPVARRTRASLRA